MKLNKKIFRRFYIFHLGQHFAIIKLISGLFAKNLFPLIPAIIVNIRSPKREIFFLLLLPLEFQILLYCNKMIEQYVVPSGKYAVRFSDTKATKVNKLRKCCRSLLGIKKKRIITRKTSKFIRPSPESWLFSSCKILSFII